MTLPREYALASQEFDRFIEDLRQRLDQTTTHQAYQTLESVFRVFRRRLTVPQAIAFAGALPAVLRAIFVADWNTGEPQLGFADRGELNREVKALRWRHDFSPPDAIEAVASVLRQHVDAVDFGRVLLQLPPGSAEFWASEQGR
jgi:uncharacterized protein (DUF2267 family)